MEVPEYPVSDNHQSLLEARFIREGLTITAIAFSTLGYLAGMAANYFKPRSSDSTNYLAGTWTPLDLTPDSPK